MLQMLIAVTQKRCKEFKMNNLGDYHNLYVRNDTLLIADVFEKFRNKYNEIYMNLVLLISYLRLD